MAEKPKKWRGGAGVCARAELRNQQAKEKEDMRVIDAVGDVLRAHFWSAGSSRPPPWSRPNASSTSRLLRLEKVVKEEVETQVVKLLDTFQLRSLPAEVPLLRQLLASFCNCGRSRRSGKDEGYILEECQSPASRLKWSGSSSGHSRSSGC